MFKLGEKLRIRKRIGIITLIILLAITILLIIIIPKEARERAKVNLNKQKIYGEYMTATVNGITWEYTLEDEKAINVHVSSGLTEEITTVIIPDILDGHSVVSLYNDTGERKNIFATREMETNTSVKKIIISNNITNIGKKAFYRCEGLTEVTIPETVIEIEEEAFRQCIGLEEITIPENVVNIGSGAFNNCTGLTKITIPGTIFIDSLSTFFNIKNIEEITLTGEGEMANYTSDTNLNTPWGQSRTNVKSIVIGDKLTSIGNYVFRDCTGLTEINIPDSVTSIGEYAFFSCRNLSEIEIPNSVTSIGKGAFCGCSELTEATIGNSVTIIGENAFKDCEKLTNATIGNKVSIIGNDSFRGCTRLTEIEIPDSVTVIGQNAFEGCTGLENITMPGTATIEVNAFKDVINVKNVILTGEGSMPNFTSNTFVYTPWYQSRDTIENLIIGERITNIGDYVFRYCTGLTEINIPDSVTSIGEGAFSRCTGLTNLVIPNGVISIGGHAFQFCENLTSINISDNLTSIEEYLFDECKNLSEVNIPSNVKSIGDYAFARCENITDVIIPEGVIIIGEGAFKDCIGLTNITIPNSVVTLRDAVFFNCPGLTTITINAENIGTRVFLGCTNLRNIIIAEGTINIGDRAFFNCASLRNIEIPSSVTKIGEDAFAGCINLISIEVDDNNTKYSSLDGILYNKDKTTLIKCPQHSAEEIIIPDTVINIESSAFYGCTGLIRITIPSSVGNIGENAFDYCNSLTIYTNNSYVNDYAISNDINCVFNQSSMTIIILGELNEWISDDIVLTIKIINIENEIVKVTVDGTEITLIDGEGTYIATENKTYTVEAIDNVENVTTKTVKIERIDKEVPRIVQVRKNIVEVTNNVELEVEAEDSLSGVKEYSFDGGSTWSTSNKKTYTENTSNILIQVKDNAGNIAEYGPISITVSEGTIEIENYEIVEENGTKYIEKIKPNATIEMLKENIETNGIVEVYDGENKITDETQKLGTGMTVKIKLNGQEETYEVVVTGDLTGDGETSISDLVKLSRYNAKLDKTVSGAYLRAAEIVRDGNIGSISDLVKLARVLAKLDNI